MVLGGQWKVLHSCLLVGKVFWDGLGRAFWYTGHLFSRLVQEVNGSFKPSSDSPCLLLEKDLDQRCCGGQTSPSGSTWLAMFS